MTDKQIIIDGVDVSGCPHIEYEYKWWNMAGHERNSENVCTLSFDKNEDFEEDFLCQDNPNCYYKQLKLAEQRIVELNKTIKAKEQECEELKKDRERWKSNFNGKVSAIEELLQQLDQLKAEVKSKTEYIQEQRDIINQYSKEIEMYKKCQGKRASKREEELKAENDELKRENELAKQLINWILKFFELTDYDWQYDQNEISFLIEDCMDDKQSTIDFVTDINKELLAKLTEIEEIAERCGKRIPLFEIDEIAEDLKQILQKISECEGNDGN